ncbi:MAG: peptidoglycan DD-metalloendopeptidase family protein [Betaproteobacteria bacterium]|nr:peptidoglycan DD-metalloendopeptidase family protein [Betaproteobacteria bacterium]
MTNRVLDFRPQSLAALVLAGALLGGCAATRQAPVIERVPQARPVPPAPTAARRPAPDARPGFHTVKKGDTLYSIALDYGLDYRELAAWNAIDPARIQVGQQVRLTPPGGAVTTAPLKTAPAVVEARPLGAATPGAPAENVKVEPKAVRMPYTDQAYAQLASLKPDASAVPKPEPLVEQKAEPARGGDDPDWIWPTNGKIIGNFTEGATLKGIAIAGRLGQPVVASAAGKVIFSGTGIRGFGKLIVIKHNNTFLSVYAHNNQLLVKEGQTVAKGQKIAEMGNTDTDRVKLHFEIRRFGKPVDPIKLLPDRAA